VLAVSLNYAPGKCVGQCSNAGRGCIGKSIYVCLKRKGRTAEIYIIAICSLHSLQHVLGNAIKACSSSEGLLKLHVFQMIHTVCQIQGKYKMKEFKGMWHLVSGKESQTMPKPNIGHFRSLGDADDNLLEH
jgi:hypothetical protein